MPHSKYIHSHAFPLVIGEMQIKTAKGNHPVCTEMAFSPVLDTQPFKMLARSIKNEGADTLRPSNFTQVNTKTKHIYTFV